MIVRALRPAIALLNWIANRTLRAVGVEPRDEVTSAFTRDEVAGLVAESRREGMLDRQRGAAADRRARVRGARRPLGPAAARRRSRPSRPTSRPREVEALAARTGYSRFPVREGERR